LSTISLPPIKNFHEPKHFASLPHNELPQFMAKLRAWTYSQPDYCRVCSSPYLAEIEAARAAGMSFYKLERRFGIPGGTIHKHLRKHSEHRRPVQHARPISTYATEAIVLIPVRKMEVQKARWGDINWEDELLILPAKRDSGEQGHKTGAKSRKAYILPLSDAAIKVLRTMETLQKQSGLKITPDGYIFPAMDARGRMRERGHMGDRTINAFLKRDFGYPDITVHGFRTTWRKWSRKYGYNPDDSEIVLNHKLGNRVNQAYDRDPIWERIDDVRKQLQDYANYCGSFQSPTSQSLPEPLPNQGEIIPFDRPVERPSRRAVLARSRRGPS
jgi:integrase